MMDDEQILSYIDSFIEEKIDSIFLTEKVKNYIEACIEDKISESYSYEKTTEVLRELCEISISNIIDKEIMKQIEEKMNEKNIVNLACSEMLKKMQADLYKYKDAKDYLNSHLDEINKKFTSPFSKLLVRVNTLCSDMKKIKDMKSNEEI